MSRLLNFSVYAVLMATRPCGGDAVADGSAPQAGYKPEVCQVAELRNGFTMQYASRDVVGPVTRLWLCAGAGYVEIPSEQIEGFREGQIAVPTAPPPSAPAETANRALRAQDRIKKVIASAASRHQIDPDFVASVVKAESGFNPTAVSPKGASGLMQLMPQTASQLGVMNVLDPAANVEGGTKYLRQLLDQYGGDAVKALAAYNAGPARVKQYGGVPPYRETRDYVDRVLEDYRRKKLQNQARSTATTTDQ